MGQPARENASYRVLVLGAGSGAANNLIRSLQAGDPSILIVGCHDDRFLLRNSLADRNYLVPAPGRASFVVAVRRVVGAERIDLLLPATDGDVEVASRLGRRLGCRMFLPRRATLALCRDKYRLTTFLGARGLPVPATYALTNGRAIDRAFRRLPQGSRAWCRIRAGNGALGSVPVESPPQVRAWIRCWTELRRVPATAFTLSEYLPGRDFCHQSLWRDGTLVLGKTYERLSYFGAGNQPGAVSSVATLAKTVSEPGVAEVATAAIRAVDPAPSGAFTVDLRENGVGVACITEINAGRLSSGTNVLDLTGKHNMTLTYVRLALGDPVEFQGEYDAAEEYYMLRDLDSTPRVFHADDFFDGIREVPGLAARGRSRA
jgi:carbamoyl-phosphate synthase large subunit